MNDSDSDCAALVKMEAIEARRSSPLEFRERDGETVAWLHTPPFRPHARSRHPLRRGVR